MLNANNAIVKLIVSIILFPTFFQEAFIDFAWGAGDPFGVMIARRLFLLLPVLAIILGCWVTVGCLLTVIFRPNRREFVTDLFLTWWDLGKSIVTFWGGIFTFIFHLFVAILGFLKMILLGIWSLIQEIIFMPFRLIGNGGRKIVSSPIPWIAVFLTLFWCLIEAIIFTYVTTPLVVDTFSNITGDTLSENFVRIPLFVFLLFVVLGSYAVLSTLVDAFKSKGISAIFGIAIIETVVLFVEVVFLYREFVDSLVPWFAQYSENFELGIFWTLAISCFVWFGIRSLSWFLFAAHGTPTIMAVIQGKGVSLSESREVLVPQTSSISSDFINIIKTEMDWVKKAGDDLVASLLLPPLQVIAAAMNFCTLLISGEHIFDLPLENFDVRVRVNTKSTREPKIVLEELSKHNESFTPAKQNIGDFQNV